MASRGLAVAQVLHPAEGPVEFVQACASLQEFVHRSLGEAKAAAIAPAKFRFFCLGVTVDLVPCECTLSFLALLDVRALYLFIGVATTLQWVYKLTFSPGCFYLQCCHECVRNGTLGSLLRGKKKGQQWSKNHWGCCRSLRKLSGCLSSSWIC